MRRRAFLRAALLAPALAAGGCRLTVEQGLMSACRNGIEPVAVPWVEEAWRGLRAERVWDMHAHLFGNGRSGAGIRVEPELDRPKTIAGRARHAFFRNGGCLGEDEERFDQAMVARLARLANEFPPGARIMLMAFDAAHDASGARRDDLSSFVVPNDYARRIAAQYPERFEWIASVHPFRPDALEELARAHAGGARAVKWLPPSMAIDLASPRCVPFYEALRRLDLPLVTHAGEEQAAPGAAHEHAGNPLLLRHPLERGVRVVAAHCATLGESPDIERVKDPAKAPRVPNFELFARLMAERRYEGLLFGDISAIAQVNRADYVGPILARREWAGRLLNGSDYPLPGILPLFSPAGLAADGLLDERALPALRSLRESNALLFDFVLKRNLRLGADRLPPSAFETRPFFQNRGQTRVRPGSDPGFSNV